MLSICIPVYNVDVRELVGELLKQANEINLPIEVLVFDDGSSLTIKNINRNIAHLTSVVYIEHSDNIGCAAIRNQMADCAKFDNLLFIDSDSEISDSYISNYEEYIGKQLILCGGRIHPLKLPSPDKSLRWKVGRVREDFEASQREVHPNQSFMSNNFLVQKRLFEQFKFDDSIKRSGHEDTMMGIELEAKSIFIKHIDNPVIHIGLESNHEFIVKTCQRIDTLLFLLNHKEEYGKLMFKRIKLLRFFYISKKFKLLKLLSFLYKKLHATIERELNSRSPNLLIYDFYKLGYLSMIYTKDIK